MCVDKQTCNSVPREYLESWGTEKMNILQVQGTFIYIIYTTNVANLQGEY